MKLILKIIIALILLNYFITTSSEASSEAESNIDIYKIDINSIDNYDLIPKGTNINAILKSNISTTKSNNDLVDFYIKDKNNEYISASGIISMASDGGRFSKYSSLQFSTNKLFLNDGREINFPSTSPLLTGAHPPHIDSGSLALARTITNFSLASSPATLGASLGISFFVNGLLSARNNGISDFVWGGLSGSGFSFAEQLLRKQPDIYLPAGTEIALTLNEDCKISNGIQKEKIEPLNIKNEEAVSQIKQLIKWGDLAGALELSVKTNQKEIYEELFKKIANNN